MKPSESSNYRNQRQSAKSNHQRSKEGKMASTDHNSTIINCNNIEVVKRELSKYREKLEEVKLESEKLKKEKISLRKSAQVTLIDCQKKYKEEIDGLKASFAKKECESNLVLAKVQKELSDIQSSDCSLRDLVSDLKNETNLTKDQLYEAQQLLENKSDENYVGTLEEDIENLKTKIIAKDIKNERLKEKVQVLNLTVYIMKIEMKEKYKAQMIKQKQEILAEANKKADAQAVLLNIRDEELKRAKVHLEEFKKATEEKEKEQKTELNNLKSEQDSKGQLIENLYSQIKEKDSEKSKAEKAFTDLFRKSRAEKKESAQEMSLLNIEYNKIGKELKGVKKNYDELKDEKKALIELVDSKSEELKAVKLQLESSEEVYKTKNFSTIVKLKSKNVEIQHKVDNASKLNNELKDQIEILKQEVGARDKMIKECKDKCAQDLKTRDENLKKIQEESSQSTKVIQSLLESKTEELTAIKLQIDISSKLNDELKAEIKTLDQKLKMKVEKSIENESFKSEIKALRESLANEKIQCVELMKLKEKDDQQISDLSKDLFKSREDLLRKLNEAEGTIADLKIKLSFKDKNISHLKKKEKQYWSPRVESLSNNINLLNVKIEGDAKENENIHSSENLQLKSTINPEQSIIMTARSVLTEFFCLQDSSDETAVKDNSTGKRPSSDIQVNVEGKKKQKLK